MRIDSLDLFDTTKSVIHEHDEVRKISNIGTMDIILTKGIPPDNTFPMSCFFITSLSSSDGRWSYLGR